MANILVLTLVYPPDNVSTAHIIGNLAVDLAAYGHVVKVITTTPHYNDDPEAEKRQPLRKFGVAMFRKSEHDGVPVLHVVIARKQKSVFRRIASWCRFHALSTIAALCSRGRLDVIICPSPPLTIGVSAWIVAGLRHAKFIYNVQEIYPDIAISLGALRSKPLIAAARRLERFVYDRAAAITVIAPHMKQKLAQRGVAEHKLSVIPNFVDVSELYPLAKDNDFARAHDLVDSFVVNYSGNVGPAQGLEIVLSAAELLRNQRGIRFVITGDGTLFRHFEEQIAARALTNVLMLPYQPFSRMPAIYSSADACVVPQAAATGYDAVPSKVYRIMACARAVLAVTDEASDLAHLVRDARCGMTTPAADAEALADVIREGAGHPEEWQAMGQRGYDYVRKHNTREVVTSQYHRLVESVAGHDG